VSKGDRLNPSSQISKAIKQTKYRKFIIDDSIYNIDTLTVIFMTAAIAKWGNSLAIRIPQAIAEQVQIQAGSAINIDIIDGKIVLTPHRRKKYTLDELLDGMTSDHLHPVISTGVSVGNEVW
jgi:antitoxin MazE